MQILVLGMHRSGTSMLTRILASLGANPGTPERLDNAQNAPENPLGFWERDDVRDVNQKLLESVDADWDRTTRWRSQSASEKALQEFETRARAIISELDALQPWVLKDPRFSLTAKHWLRLMSTPMLVVAVRSPVEVALSLRQRNDFPLDLGLSLWEDYTLRALQAAHGVPHALAHYGEFVAAPDAAIGRLRSALGAALPEGNVSEKLQEFVDPDLYRSRAPFAATDLGEAHPSLDIHRRLVAGETPAAFANQELSEASRRVIERHEAAYRRLVYRVGRRLVPAAIDGERNGTDVVNLDTAQQARALDIERSARREIGLVLEIERLHLQATRRELAQVRAQQAQSREWRRTISSVASRLQRHAGELRRLARKLGAVAPETLVVAQVDPAASEPQVGTMLQAVAGVVEHTHDVLAAMSPRVDDLLRERESSRLDLMQLEVAAGALLAALPATAVDAEASGECERPDAAVDDTGPLQSAESMLHAAAARASRLRHLAQSRERELELARRQLEQVRRQLEQAEQAIVQANSERDALAARCERSEDDLVVKTRQHADDAVRISRLAQQNAALADVVQRSATLLQATRVSWRWRVGDRLVRMAEKLLRRPRTRLALEEAHDALVAARRLPVAPVPVSAASRTPQPPIARLARPSRETRQPASKVDRERWLGEGWTAVKPLVEHLQRERYPQWEQENARRAACYGERLKGGQAAWQPKVMIGTMYSGENEFESCKAAIGRLSYRNIEHVVISGLPNREAHDALFTRFLSSDCDLLVKIDADMVIVDEGFVDRVVRVFEGRPDLGLLQMAILDFYSGAEIQGVNAYSKLMRWDAARQHALFTDVTATAREHRMVVWGTFLRSVVHSPDPSPFQAFHFGVHRAVKAVAALEEGQRERALEQLMYLERTYEHYELRRAPSLLFACLGTEAGLRGEYSVAELDYTNPRMKKRFEVLQRQPRGELVTRLQQLRVEDTGNADIDALRRNRPALSRRPTLRRMLLLLPHLGLFGGVNRFLEIARYALMQGVEATIAVPERDPVQVDRVHADFPDIEIVTVEDALTQSWDAVICGDFSSALMTTLPWFDAGVTAIYLLNGWFHRHLNAAQIALARPHLVLANSSYVLRHYADLAPALVAGAVDTDVFSPGERIPFDGLRPLRVGVPAGRAKPRKGFEFALRALELVHVRGLSIELHVVNAVEMTLDTPYPYVCHTGVSRTGMAELLRSLDVYVCPETDGGWNNSAAEAMACGTPVVCTEAGTLDFAVDGASAVVVPCEDPAAIALALERLAADDALRDALSRNGPQAVAPFNWFALTRNLIDTLESTRIDPSARRDIHLAARKAVVAEACGGAA